MSEAGRSDTSHVSEDTHPVGHPLYIKPPQLTLPIFKDNDSDVFAFKNFLAHFKNAVALHPGISDAQKMIYLRSALQGRAFQLIQSLSVSANNYVAAMTLLRGEFLQQDTLISYTLEQLDSAQPSYSPDFSGVKVYIGVIRAYLAELEDFGLDFLVRVLRHAFL
jgi:hypothetical protein